MAPRLKFDNRQRRKRQKCRNLKEVGLRFIAGAAADYVVVSEYTVTIVRDNVPLKSAMLTEPMATAYNACDRSYV